MTFLDGAWTVLSLAGASCLLLYGAVLIVKTALQFLANLLGIRPERLGMPPPYRRNPLYIWLRQKNPERLSLCAGLVYLFAGAVTAGLGYGWLLRLSSEW